MNQLFAVNLNTFRWKGFWKAGVSRSANGQALFTVDGLRYYAFWHRKFHQPVPVDGMPYDNFVLDFLTVMKLRYRLDDPDNNGTLDHFESRDRA